MAGRNTIPLDVMENSRRVHRSNKEKNQRKLNENKIEKLSYLQLKKVKIPQEIKENEVALKYWKMQFKHYVEAAKKGIEIISLSDIDIFTEYCMVCARHEILKKRFDELLLDGDYKKDLDISVNRTLKMKIALTDKLFLNPIARIKNVPVKKEEKPNDPSVKFDL